MIDCKHWQLLNKLENYNLIQNDKNQTFKINNKSCTNSQEIAEAFAHSLASTFNTNANLALEHTHTSVSDNSSVLIDRNELLSSLNSLYNRAAPGNDGINNKLLKKCPLPTLNRIHNIFNASISLGYVPIKWKISKIIMIPKKDKPPDEITSYRPISLLCCLSKWLEKIINTKIMNWLEHEKLLPDIQAGFRKHHSTQDQILLLNQAILYTSSKQWALTSICLNGLVAF